MKRLFDPQFWKEAGWAVARTALAALAVFVPELVANPLETWQPAALTVALATAVGTATALANLPDATGAPWWERALAKGLRQFGQMVVAASASAVVFTDVAWGEVLPLAAGSALATVILAALSFLPGAEAEAGEVLLAEVDAQGVWSVPDLTPSERKDLLLLRDALDAPSPARDALDRLLG